MCKYYDECNSNDSNKYMNNSYKMKKKKTIL